MSRTLELGTVDFGSKVYASDPCYTADTWCLVKLENVLPGEYRCYAVIEDTGSWGDRVSHLYAVHSDYILDRNQLEPVEGDVGVDSGQCGLYDADYFLQTRDNEDWYWAVCDVTGERSGYTGGVYQDKCVVSCSGYGDGGYELSVQRDDDGKIVAMDIDFFVEEDFEREKEKEKDGEEDMEM